ncbi:MAG: S49 family peptidase [Pseudomonadota bacterium]
MSENGFLAAATSWLPEKWTKSRPLVPVLRFSGPIGVSSPFKQELSLPTVASAIDKAFSMKGAKAVAIQINSPGGAPVQSTLIYKRVRALAEEKDLKVYVFCEDVAASGGYMLSLAGDEIYADPSSIVGSIGVIAAGFGFPELMEKIGVERRVYTAGKSKDTLDPFLPEKPADVERIKGIQLDVHEAFIDMVKSRRGAKLTKPDDELFTGAFWSGKAALELGLIDGLSDLRTKMREVFGEDVRFKLISSGGGLLRRGKKSVSAAAGGFDLARLPQGFAADAISAIEARALWARFGL